MNLILQHLPHWTAAGFIGGLFSFVGFCSFLSIFLAVIERWAKQWFANSRFAFWVSALNDLVTQFGALNLRDKIVPWTGQDRRGDEK